MLTHTRTHTHTHAHTHTYTHTHSLDHSLIHTHILLYTYLQHHSRIKNSSSSMSSVPAAVSSCPEVPMSTTPWLSLSAVSTVREATRRLSHQTSTTASSGSRLDTGNTTRWVYTRVKFISKDGTSRGQYTFWLKVEYKVMCILCLCYYGMQI